MCNSILKIKVKYLWNWRKQASIQKGEIRWEWWNWKKPNKTKIFLPTAYEEEQRFSWKRKENWEMMDATFDWNNGNNNKNNLACGAFWFWDFRIVKLACVIQLTNNVYLWPVGHHCQIFLSTGQWTILTSWSHIFWMSLTVFFTLFTVM